MALVKMKRATAVTYKTDKEALYNLLIKSGAVELTPTASYEGLQVKASGEGKDIYTGKLARLTFAFSLLKDYRKKAERLALKDKNYEYKAPKVGFFEYARPSVTLNLLREIEQKEDSLLRKIDELENLNNRIMENASSQTRVNNLLEQAKVYEEVDSSFASFRDTKKSSFVLGTISNDKISLLNFDNIPTIDYMIFPVANCQVTAIALFSTLDVKDDVAKVLSSCDFVRASFNEDILPHDLCEKYRAESKSLAEERDDIIKTIVTYDEFESDFKLLYDSYELHIKELTAEDNFLFTKETFILEFWCPIEAEKVITDTIAKSGIACDIEYRDPLPDETYPTLAYNNKIVRPYEDITNMYSVPNCREQDPNSVMAFFYFLLFGIMLGDAAYGLILSIVGFTLYILKKPRKGEGNLILVIAMCGISTVFWGVMFGSWFGEELIPAVLFVPMEEPLLMLGMSLGLGLFQICFGLGMKAVADFKAHHPLDAIFGQMSWWVLFIGLGLFAGSAFGVASLKLPGIIVMSIGGAMVLIGGSLGKKGFAKITGAFANMYSITGFLSDILSYARLFGLGLATAVVGMVVNKIAMVIADLIPVVGWLIAVIILIVGHLFNIGINTLGTYVHNCRLQYIEFFSRFYTGAGHQFIPFGSDTRYTYLLHGTNTPVSKPTKKAKAK